MKNKIIAISGMDATGKSTMLLTVKNELERRKIPYIVTKQPSKYIKEWDCFKKILKNDSNELDFKTIGGLISWGRLNTQICEIEPALKAGYCVICERYILDIIAWSRFRGAKQSWIESWIAPLFKADVSILCDAEANVVLGRIKERQEGEKIGEDSLVNISRVLSLYKKEALNSDTIIIDTSRTLDELKERVYELMEVIM